VRFPELEFAHYIPTRHWRQLLDNYDYHMSVSGSVLATFPISSSSRPCLAWIATPYLADRKDRARLFPYYRRLVDRLIDVPLCLRMEKRSLRSARILALSNYTAKQLRRISPEARITTMPMPIPTPSRSFEQLLDDRRRTLWRIGFAGRYDDPRKNVQLLIDCLAIARRRGREATLHLVGAEPTDCIRRHAQSSNVERHIIFEGRVSQESLADFYTRIDIFVIPSHQEGLGIVGLEAMANGCPVVSTRCGGPEDYVRHGENGFLTGFDPTMMTDAVCTIADDRALRRRMGEAAMTTVTRDYSDKGTKSTFWQAVDETYGTRKLAT